eukprot:4642952-Amphidinium_carterae.1
MMDAALQFMPMQVSGVRELLLSQVHLHTRFLRTRTPQQSMLHSIRLVAVWAQRDSCAEVARQAVHGKPCAGSTSLPQDAVTLPLCA